MRWTSTNLYFDVSFVSQQHFDHFKMTILARCLKGSIDNICIFRKSWVDLFQSTWISVTYVCPAKTPLTSASTRLRISSTFWVSPLAAALTSSSWTSPVTWVSNNFFSNALKFSILNEKTSTFNYYHLEYISRSYITTVTGSWQRTIRCNLSHSRRVVRPRSATYFYFKIVVVVNLLNAPDFSKCLYINKYQSSYINVVFIYGYKGIVVALPVPWLPSSKDGGEGGMELIQIKCNQAI